VLDCVDKELLTPFGMRTLSRKNPAYRGKHEGNPASRDEAYHQGTVWAWLLGPFITAYFRVRGRSQDTIDAARGFIEPFRDHLRQAGLGTVSEIFDGDPPYTPRGCISNRQIAQIVSRNSCSQHQRQSMPEASPPRSTSAPYAWMQRPAKGMLPLTSRAYLTRTLPRYRAGYA
jgi:hypothetical protein